jgi:HD-GYP domain-containing protein (c-di-GMP phosphodiesterase class II)
MVVLDAHKNIISYLIEKLGRYDARRPDGHPYEFHTHSKRVALSVQDLARAMGYDDNMCETLYWATLPHDVGKISLPVAIWDLENKPTDEQRTERRTHTQLGVDILSEEFGNDFETDPFLRLCHDITLYHHETLDKKGPLEIDAGILSQEVRMACICDAFDGWSVSRPHFDDRDISPAAVIHRMETEKAGQFDPDILQIFKELKSCQ